YRGPMLFILSIARFFKQFPLNIRRRFLRDMVILLLFVSGAILIVAIKQGSSMREEMSQFQTRQITGRAAGEFERFARPVTRSLKIVRKWGLAGTFHLNDVRSLNNHFIPILEDIPQISSTLMANSEGKEYCLIKSDTIWTTRSTGLAGGEKNILWQYWKNASTVTGEKWEKSDYTPLSRPWFTGALDSVAEGEIFWTNPYPLYTTKEPGITASIRWRDRQESSLTYVAAFDVLLRDVFSFISGLQVSKHGKVFIINENGALFSEPQNRGITGHSEKSPAIFIPVRNAGVALIADAVSSWIDGGKRPNLPFRFMSNGENSWAEFRPLNPDDNSIWIGVALPEKDLHAGGTGRWLNMLLPVMGILVFGVLVAVFLSRRYIRKADNLPKQTISDQNFEREIAALIDAGESSTLEFKSTMRKNLKTGRAGKEIEMVWLKTIVAFLNTEGGILIFGVDDSGKIAGIEADEFESDDKCRLHFKNLINQHIGLEFSKFLEFDVRRVKGKTLAIARCRKSNQPVFLLTKNEETFYIRSGPASVKLSPSKVLKYLKDAGK
ncbi:MAG: RNA-binding domain-containing protein, partial [Calditrichia bacterium]